MPMRGLLQSKSVLGGATLLLVATFAISFTFAAIPTAHAAPSTLQASAQGGLDCNGFSATGQKPFISPSLCTDLRGSNGERFEDNGHYIGHDEPSTQFNSQVPGSGNNVQYSLTLPKEHPLPATQTFENQIAFWFSMALCDPGSYPQAPCTPNSDTNNPSVAVSALEELHFYPPGF